MFGPTVRPGRNQVLAVLKIGNLLGMSTMDQVGGIVHGTEGAMGVNMVGCICCDGEHAAVPAGSIRLLQVDLPSEQGVTGSPSFHEDEFAGIFFSDVAESVGHKVQRFVPADLHPAGVFVQSLPGVRALERVLDPVGTVIPGDRRESSPHAKLAAVGRTVGVSLGFHDDAVPDPDKHPAVILKAHGAPALQPLVLLLLLFHICIHVLLNATRILDEGPDTEDRSPGSIQQDGHHIITPLWFHNITHH